MPHPPVRRHKLNANTAENLCRLLSKSLVRRAEGVAIQITRRLGGFQLILHLVVKAGDLAEIDKLRRLAADQNKSGVTICIEDSVTGFFDWAARIGPVMAKLSQSRRVRQSGRDPGRPRAE